MAIDPRSLDEIISDSVKALQKALEVDMLYGCPRHEVGLRNTLTKLGIKSARVNGLIFGGALQMEDLSATFASITFNDTHLSKLKKLT